MSINLEQINSGDDYADVLIDQMQQSMVDARNEGMKEMEPGLFETWCNEVRKCCNENYDDYIVGKRDTFMMSDEQMGETWNVALYNYATDAINNLYETELIEVKGVDMNGEMLYGLSDEGERIMREYGGEADDV